MEIIKGYVLADLAAQKIVDLREYGEIITDAVFRVIGNDDVAVVTYENCYCIDMSRPATEVEEIAIEAILCDSELGKFSSIDGTLFHVV